MAENGKTPDIRDLNEGLRDIFLAGVGALATGAEKSKELVDALVEKGELTVDQGKKMNQELKHKGSEATRDVRGDALEARMKAMTPEERDAFAAMAAEFAAKQNAAEAEGEGASSDASAGDDSAESE